MCEKKGVDSAAKRLLNDVEKMRRELHEIFAVYGLSSPLVVHKSQELDALLNRYNGLLQAEKQYKSRAL